MSKVIKVEELGCGYKWSNEYNQLMWCPMFKDGTLDTDNWGAVDEPIVGEELVEYKGVETTLSEVYRDVERELGVSNE